jgi:hypothetical protein
MKAHAFSTVHLLLFCSVVLLGCEPIGSGSEGSTDASVAVNEPSGEGDSDMSGASEVGQQVHVFVQPRDSETSFGTTPIKVGLSASGSPDLEESFEQLAGAVRLMEVDLEQDPARWQDTETEFEVVKDASPDGHYTSWTLEAPTDQLAKDRVYVIELVELPEGLDMINYHGFVWNKDRISWVSRFIRTERPVIRGFEICPGISGSGRAQFTAHLSERVSVDEATAQAFSLFEGTTEFSCEMQTPPNRALPDGTVRGEFGVEFVCDGSLDRDTTYLLSYEGGLTTMTGESVYVGLFRTATSFQSNFKLSDLLYDGRPCRWLGIL